jgi:hypothetical protein
VTSNGCNQRLAALGEPHRGILSRVRCIAWFDVIPSRGPAAFSPSPHTA